MIGIYSIEKYKEAITEHEVCMVKIGTTWCGPCKVVQKNIQSIEKEYPNVYFIDVDAEEASEISDLYDIHTVPAVLVIKNGEVISQTFGLQTKEQLEKRLKLN